jgi:hypothetical protein
MRDTSRYYVDGVRLPSVTECLDLCGLTDFSMVPPRILQRASERGSDFHSWRQAIDDGLIDADMVPPQSIATRVEGYRRFIADTGFVVESSEQVVTHAAMRYVGTYDLLGSMPDGRRYVVDTKAVAAITPATRIQLVGYALAIEPQPLRAALWLRPDGSYRFLPYTDRGDVHDWTACVRIAHFRLAHGLAKIKES